MSDPAAVTGMVPPESMVELVVAVASFAVMYALYCVVFPTGSMTQRARSYAKHRRTSRPAAKSRAKVGVRQKLVDMVRGLLERLKLTRGDEVRKTTDLLIQAGWRNPDALTVLMGIRLALPVGLGILAYVLGPVFAPHAKAMTRLVVAFFGIAAGGYGPTYVVKSLANKRKQKVQHGLSDALDLFVICAEAGLSLDAAINRVAAEIGVTAPELADELQLTAIELGFLPNRKDALDNLSRRVDLASVRNLVTTLTQTERYGTPLAHSLRMLANEFRNARMMRAEEKAARLPATLTVPMIVFILPPLFTILVGPAIIQVMGKLQ